MYKYVYICILYMHIYMYIRACACVPGAFHLVTAGRKTIFNLKKNISHKYMSVYV